MSLRTLTLPLALLAVSCSGSRVDVTLDQAVIRSVDHATIFAEHLYPGAAVGPPRQVVQLKISSQTELIKHFTDRGKQLQVRCSVNGTADRKAYSESAFGPFPEASSSTTRHHYSIYAYVDLKAHATEYKSGKPVSTLDLKTEQFDSLSCQLVGVEMAPWPFLKSNDLTVSASTFHALLRQAPKQ